MLLPTPTPQTIGLQKQHRRTREWRRPEPDPHAASAALAALAFSTPAGITPATARNLKHALQELGGSNEASSYRRWAPERVCELDERRRVGADGRTDLSSRSQGAALSSNVGLRRGSRLISRQRGVPPQSGLF